MGLHGSDIDFEHDLLYVRERSTETAGSEAQDESGGAQARAHRRIGPERPPSLRWTRDDPEAEAT